MDLTCGSERQVNSIWYTNKEDRILFIKTSTKFFLMIIMMICVLNPVKPSAGFESAQRVI